MDNKTLEQDINDMVEQLEKANTIEDTEATAEDYSEFLSNIKELGKDAVKESFESMTEDQQNVFKSILAKAIEFDKEATTRQPTLQQQSESVDRQQDKQKEDEKLMKEKAAQHKHQGDNSQLEGQVIKSETSEVKEEVKSEDVEKAKKPEPKEKEESKKDEKKEHEMYSDDMLGMMMNRAMEKGLSKYKMLGALEKKGYDMKKCEGMWSKNQESFEKKMKESMKKSDISALEAELNAQVKQPELPEAEKQMRVKMQSNTQAVEELTGELVVKKSVKWTGGTQDLLKACSLGRNYSVKAEAIIDREEEIKKSQTEDKSKNDSPFNDLIEKGLDMSECDAVEKAKKPEEKESKKDEKNEEKKPKEMPKMMKKSSNSFSDADILAACNISQEDADKILKN